ncbi:MAG: GIN domain-containing protein, partial [Flavobacteriales bacterium]
ELFISNNNTCNFMRRYDHALKMKICAPAFPKIQNFGTGRVFTSDTLHGAFFQLENRSASGTVDLILDMDSLVVASHTGVADVALRGKARVANYFNQGLGLFQADEMHAVHVYANNSSIQDMSIRGMGYLFARIDYSGNIYYAGSPTQIDLDERSNGRLLPLQH